MAILEMLAWLGCKIGADIESDCNQCMVVADDVRRAGYAQRPGHPLHAGVLGDVVWFLAGVAAAWLHRLRRACLRTNGVVAAKAAGQWSRRQCLVF